MYIRLIWKMVLAIFFAFPILCNAQNTTSIITGKVFNAINKDPLIGATVNVQQATAGVVTDSSGSFTINSLPPGLYNLEFRFQGFETYIEFEVRTYNVKPTYVEVGLIPKTYSLNEVVIDDVSSQNTMFAPISVNKLQWSEMQRLPGATLDLSKVIQSYPGVLPKSSFGYNIVVRGGAPNENGYYLDGIKIPAINHFSVQGASGGPNGLVNLDFVKGMDLYSSAFPIAYGNSLSAVMDITQRDGRTDRMGMRFTLGATDIGATIEGPLFKNANFILSGRRSFSEYMLKAFGVPVLPAYDDMQFRSRWQIDDKNEVIITGIAGFDKYRLNTGAAASDALLYNVGYIPEGDQQVSAYGISYKHYLGKSFYRFVVSRNGFNNTADKFLGNTYLENDRLLKYRSTQHENNVRFEHSIYEKNWEFKYGLNANQAQTSFDVYGFDIQGIKIDTVNFKENISYMSYGAFGSLARSFFNQKLGLSMMVRTDAANISNETSNLLNHFSPRITANYVLSKKWNLKANSGFYNQLPPDVLIAYQKQSPLSKIDYMRVFQNCLGAEYSGNNNFKIKVDIYHKMYDRYPFLLRDSISYANAMADYVVVGNQPSTPTSQGRAYGFEFFAQQRLKRNFWWLFSYTYSRSQFMDKNGTYRSSSWESPQFLSFTGGKKWKKGWQLGIKWRYSEGTPYTPYNIEQSSNINVWNVANRGIFDYSKINQERLPSFHQMDLRLDKRYLFKGWNMNIFFDIQNFYSSKIKLIPYLTNERDANWQPIVDANDPSKYVLKTIQSDTGRRLYSIGIIADF